MDTALLPRISVIVPVYNASRTLEQCLESLEQQTDTNYEIVVVDDCSTDGSLEIAEKTCERAGFTLVTLTANKGQAVARNEGARVSKGEILVFVDSDVTVPEDWLAKYRQLLDTHAGTDVICSGYVVSHGDPAPALFASHEAFFRRLSLPSLDLRSLTSANCVMYRSVFEEAGGFPEYYIDAMQDHSGQKAAATNEDSELGFLISENGRKILWTHDNYIGHHFRDSWRGYLKQQLASSRSGTLSVFKFPKMAFTKDLYSGEKILPQLAVMVLMLLSFAGLFLGREGLLAAGLVQVCGLLFFALYHRRFFRHLGSDGMEGYARFRIFFWMIVTRLVWVYGVTLGLKDGCLMRWNHHRKKRFAARMKKP